MEKVQLLEQLLTRWESDVSSGRSFARRCEIAEQLDAAMLSPELQLRAAGLIQQLEAADARFFQRLRARLRAGRYTPTGMLRGLQRYAAREDDFEGYAPLDVLLAGLFDAGELPEEEPREPEMVFYQPAPGRVILALLQHIRPTDVFYDIGAGLGRVALAVALFSAAKAYGVENQPAFCEYASRVAHDLNARNTHFLAQDARAAHLADGTIFFLYTPFRGAILQEVLNRLRGVAANGCIRICTFGPCTIEVSREPWLQLRSGSLDAEHLAVFQSTDYARA